MVSLSQANGEDSTTASEQFKGKLSEKERLSEGFELPAFKGYVDDRDLFERFEQRGFENDFESLVSISRDKKAERLDRETAIRLLEKKFGEKAVNVLAGILESDFQHFMKKSAAFSLANLGDRRAIPIIKELMENQSELFVKAGFAFILSKVGDFSGLVHVLELSKSNVAFERKLGASYLRLFFKNRETIQTNQKKDILKEYLAFGKDNDAKVRREFLHFWPTRKASEHLNLEAKKILEHIIQTDPDLYNRKIAQVRLNEIKSKTLKN